MILDVTGKELPAIKVFTESIRFLKDHFLEMFTDKKLGFTINDVFFVITVPAIWSDAAKQFMRVASEKVIYLQLIDIVEKSAEKVQSLNNRKVF